MWEFGRGQVALGTDARLAKNPLGVRADHAHHHPPDRFDVHNTPPPLVECCLKM